MNSLMKKATIAFLAFVILVGVVYATYTTWSRTISWTGVEIKEFTVWNAETGGTEITSTETEVLGVVSSPLVRDFYIQNDGNVPITVSVTNEVPSGCTASWSGTDSYSVPTGTVRTLATLTLVITSAGSYSWDFVVS